MVQLGAVFFMLGVVLGVWVVDARLVLLLVLATVLVFSAAVVFGEYWALFAGIIAVTALELGYAVGLVAYATAKKCQCLGWRLHRRK